MSGVHCSCNVCLTTNEWAWLFSTCTGPFPACSMRIAAPPNLDKVSGSHIENARALHQGRILPYVPY